VFEGGAECILYKEMLDKHFKLCKAMDDKKKVSTLTNSIGMQNYKMLRDISHPNLHAEKSTKNCALLMKEFYTKKTSSFRERKSFYIFQKSTTKSINDWLVRAQSVAVNCEFGASLSTILCDYFISGLKK
jgi:chemotaxis methyl-accepting protein methylase